jgi:uncharacterized protein
MAGKNSAARFVAALTVLLLSWLSALPAAAASPSFACGGALALTERVICADESLAALDVAMAAAYQKELAALPQESANQLEETRGGLMLVQKAWLAHRNQCGANKACIRRAYALRTRELTYSRTIPDVPCRDTIGAKAAAVLVRQCIQVKTATHPPCNAANSCELIASHNINRCQLAGDSAPKFCASYK